MMQERGQHFEVRSVTILGGTDKSGQPEDVRIALEAGQVISVVGPTGSGKSRLLADIEWMAQADTPTGRRIFINGEPPPPEWRYALEHKLVAQLSQNMNFVMDLSVERFIAMHGQSRRTEDIEQKQSQILQAANALAGEPLSGDTPLTALSGGQSRALMIADTAFLSVSPIVLIDEIENAGIDRQQAVNLLIRAGKIVVIATHDPMLALTAERRLVISNGGIVRILETSEEEQACLVALERMNRKMNRCRERLRNGQTVSLADLR
jgi:ABC-type lipoprotein export system ATPase subunit